MRPVGCGVSTQGRQRSGRSSVDHDAAPARIPSRGYPLRPCRRVVSRASLFGSRQRRSPCQLVHGKTCTTPSERPIFWGRHGARLFISMVLWSMKAKCRHEVCSTYTPPEYPTPPLDGIFTPDGKHPIYAIDTMPHGGRSFRHQVYWLPWSHNEAVGLNTLDDSNADMFLTSGFSGCHFVSCDGVLMHTAAGYAAVAESTLPVAEAFKFDRRGGSPTVPRAIVMGWRPRQTKHWFFAYEDIDAARKDYRIWKPLRG